MSDPVETGTTLRDTIEASFDAAENGTLEPVVETSRPVEDRIREENGRFAQKAETAEAVIPESQQEKNDLQRPTTWKKDYLPIWDKLATGQPLLPDEARKLAQYSNQREKEYASGVSTYRAEAENARTLQEAIAPFIPNLQKANLDPKTWITNLGRAHEVLALGSAEQKLQAFHKLAQDYGIPLAAVAGQAQGGVPPIVTQLMQQINALQGQVSTVSSWREQQETQKIQDTITQFSSDTQKHPHFEAVKATMAQLLESGLAKDLEEAYTKAIRFNDDIWDQERQAQSSTIAKSTAVAKAKAAAVSVKSSSPTGQTTGSGTKDRRAILSEQLDAAFSGRV